MLDALAFLGIIGVTVIFFFFSKAFVKIGNLKNIVENGQSSMQNHDQAVQKILNEQTRLNEILLKSMRENDDSYKAGFDEVETALNRLLSDIRSLERRLSVLEKAAGIKSYNLEVHEHENETNFGEAKNGRNAPEEGLDKKA